MARNAGAIVAIELLAAVEGMDCRGPIRSNARLEAVRALVRDSVPSMASDWEFSAALRAAETMVSGGSVLAAAGLCETNPW
jgi:histidine ammonia-lyase